MFIILFLVNLPSFVFVEEELVVATTRPETVFGDVAIAVHPDDERYSRYIGRNVFHPLRETFIPIIADSSVKREFGTGKNTK